MANISREKLSTALESEMQFFIDQHPLSAEQAERSTHLLGGVPMAWMTRWPGSFPVIFDTAVGAQIIDIDGNEYLDFCLGDTGAMAGHALPQVAEAVSHQARRGLTTMLPSMDAEWVAEELSRRFMMPLWQMAMTATDANRFVLRFARHITGRKKVLVFDWCYHGTVDEAFATLDDDGRVITRPGTLGAPVPAAETTKVVQFNDLEALEDALADRDVACVLAEPALTNIGIVRPDPGFHEALREICTRTGTLLIIDETHTLCLGEGGATLAWGLKPDMVVIGKAIGGGVPVAAYGMTHSVADQLTEAMYGHEVDVSGVGGTLTGSALALAAVRATLSTTLLESDFDTMIPLAAEWTAGVQRSIDDLGLPWSVNQLGCRAEYWFCPPPRNGRDAAAAIDAEMDEYLHLFALNRGIVLAPFHNMALFSPAHTSEHVDRHTAVFDDAIRRIVSDVGSSVDG